MSKPSFEGLVRQAIQNANAARTPENQLGVDADAPLFGPGSPLDSLGLVALLMDVEEAFANAGIDITLGDERAMSQRLSPFRTVGTLITYVQGLVDAEGSRS